MLLELFSEAKYNFVSLQSAVEADNLVEMIDDLADLVAMTESLIDQSQNNFDVILEVVSTTSFIVRNNDFNDTDLGEVG